MLCYVMLCYVMFVFVCILYSRNCMGMGFNCFELYVEDIVAH